MGLLCGMIDRTPSASVEGTGSIPGPGRFHMRSTEARVSQLLKPVSLWSPAAEAAAVRNPSSAMKSSPSLLQLEKDREQQRRPSTSNKWIQFLKMIKSMYHDMSPTNSREWLGFQTNGISKKQWLVSQISYSYRNIWLDIIFAFIHSHCTKGTFWHWRYSAKQDESFPAFMELAV